MPEFSAYHHVPDPVEVSSIPTFEYRDIKKGDQIGAGGDANVYRARINKSRESYQIAIKEPRFDNTVQTEIFERFEREAETWANLDDHQNIVTVYGHGTDSLPWIALEYMDGETLSQYTDSISLEQSLWLAGRIAEGIRYGHRHGVAHLDLKPNNILLRETAEGLWDYPKVSDWGLARLLLEHSKSVEALSPTYSAPEQFDSSEYGKTDDITDIYQFGAIVYELVTGQPPFKGSATEVMQSVLNEQPTPPSKVNTELPKEIDQIILKSLSKEKTERYESVLLFRRRLDDLFFDQVDINRPEGESDRGDTISTQSETAGTTASRDTEEHTENNRSTSIERDTNRSYEGETTSEGRTESSNSVENTPSSAASENVGPSAGRLIALAVIVLVIVLVLISL